MKVISEQLILLLLINVLIVQLAWEPLNVDFDVGNESATESLQKKKEQNCNIN